MSKTTSFIIIFVMLDLVATGIFSDILNWVWVGIWSLFIVFLIVFHFSEKKNKKIIKKNQEG